MSLTCFHSCCLSLGCRIKIQMFENHPERPLLPVLTPHAILAPDPLAPLLTPRFYLTLTSRPTMPLTFLSHQVQPLQENLGQMLLLGKPSSTSRAGFPASVLASVFCNSYTSRFLPMLLCVLAYPSPPRTPAFPRKPQCPSTLQNMEQRTWL